MIEKRDQNHLAGQPACLVAVRSFMVNLGKVVLAAFVKALKTEVGIVI